MMTETGILKLVSCLTQTIYRVYFFFAARFNFTASNTQPSEEITAWRNPRYTDYNDHAYHTYARDKSVADYVSHFTLNGRLFFCQAKKFTPIQGGFVVINGFGTNRLPGIANNRYPDTLLIKLNNNKLVSQVDAYLERRGYCRKFNISCHTVLTRLLKPRWCF